MGLPEYLFYGFFALAALASVGYYVYGLFRPAPKIEPVPAERIPVLEQEQKALLLESRIFDGSSQKFFQIAVLLAFGLVFTNIPNDPPHIKEISEERLAQLLKAGAALVIIQIVGSYAIDRDRKNVIRAVLDQGAKPSMSPEARQQRLEEIKSQLKLARRKP